MASPDFSHFNPHDWVLYGPTENCTLALCPIKYSIYEYRPSLAASVSFIALFGISLLIHLYQGFRWHKWAFMVAIFLGCVCEMVGYGGRILLWQNPFSFSGFITQIVCITIGPAFYSAAIYFNLSEMHVYMSHPIDRKSLELMYIYSVVYLGTQYSRLPPAAYYYIFISCDVVSLTLQGTGGGMSSSSSGKSYVGVNIAIAGLSSQVFSLTVFTCLAVDYAIRYWRGHNAKTTKEGRITKQLSIFVGFLAFAVICILIRCVYRIDELSKGYTGSSAGQLLHNQGLFIALEGVMILAAVFALNIAHPGPVFAKQQKMAIANPEVTAAQVEGSELSTV